MARLTRREWILRIIALIVVGTMLGSVLYSFF